MHRAWVEIDLAAVERNAKLMAERSGVSILPMVKSDAYGLGVDRVVETLEPLEPWGYGVATVAEGAQLRSLGIARPVLVFTPPLASDFPAIRAASLTPTFGDADRIAQWSADGGADWHLAIDTGMSRTGIVWDAIADVVDACRAHPPQGAFTHFHSAEIENGSMEEQADRFAKAIRGLPARPRVLHVENSAAITRQSPSAWDLVRPGIFLYGAAASDRLRVAPEPVVSLRGRVVEVREIPAGAAVSYRATWRADRPTRLATVGAGYADGVNRRLSNGGVAIVNGEIAPIRGVVTMDMTMIDISDIQCQVGDVVTFIGDDGGRSLTVNEVARRAEISPYELLVGLKQRADRVYHA